MKKTRTAFSLIELSIVVLIIGILIAGVNQASKLYNKFKIQTASQLTRSSPVNGIKNLVLWFETSTSESFLQSDINDDGKISTWYNIGKQKSFIKNASVILNNDAYDCGISRSPFYTENAINGLPMISFRGNQCINFDGSVINNTDFTIFTVGKVKSFSNTWHFFISGQANAGGNICLGFRGSTNLLYFWNFTASEASNVVSLSASYSFQDRPIILSAWYSKTLGKKLWANGGLSPAASNATQTESIYDHSKATMGKFIGASTYYASDMDMAELIIFQRALNNEERMAVEKYLGQKYNISTK